MGPVIFLPYINDLPKIINKISAPIISADDTSIIFAHSNFIDFRSSIHIVFETLNGRVQSKRISSKF